MNRTELLYVLFTNMSNWIEKKTLSLYFYIFNALRILVKEVFVFEVIEVKAN